ncbi:metallophosphoesterase family protein [Cognatiluteimonas telluris]|jgi:3',5'-cyclic AMP phosphodiesterase CpdA|uniref:metallophosphoesterase family protein n=1 Tax=Cognatiluteimonas telluris TaxID=1104775 RepID=UPI00140BEC68|nr:metallophosphoesterase family protein [Lysobacter telluris]
MRTIAHLSDLHFGRVDPVLLDPLVAAVTAAAPDVVAISGDLTQRAKAWQFEQADAFLQRLPQPCIVVPGNHDVPLYDVLRRFAAPLRRYRRIITPDLAPFHRDDAIAVLGLNTARSLTFKGGRLNEEQLALARERLAPLDEDIVRVVVTHHPFDLPAHGDEDDIVGRAHMAMRTFAHCGIDLFLSGHLHVSHAAGTAGRYAIPGFAALVVQAGTATSTRGRGEANSFNVIRTASARIEVETHSWQPGLGAFAASSRSVFTRNDGIWAPAP